MAKKIEILENTLLKLLVRRGDDLDRQNIKLSEGELGYTVDNKRLFIGDSSTLGGNVVGNVYQGAFADQSTVIDAVEGDIVFNNTSNTIYFKTDTGWLSASQILEAGDDTIDINSGAGTISVGTLSAGNFSADIVGNSIELVSGRISLSSTQIKTDRISANSSTHLKLPGDLNINSVDYTFPVGGLGSNQVYLGADATGDLHWRTPDKSSTFYFNSSAAAVPVGTVVAAASGANMPTGWLICNGQSVTVAAYGDLYAVFGYQYGGSGANFTIPDYNTYNAVLVGTSDPASFTPGTLTSTGATYTTEGVVYFIKAEADDVVETTLSVQGGLTATKDGVPQTSTFSLLDGAVEIGTSIPGVSAVETAIAAMGVFTTKATFTKFWLTGSGSRGGSRTGGAAATVYGILSAPIGTDIGFTVGAGITTNHTDGNPSTLLIPPSGTELARSNGATFQLTGIVSGTAANTGSLLTSDSHVIGGHIIPGGSGGWDTNDGREEALGAPSFWGSDQAPGAGAGGHNGDSINTGDGLIKFEWGS